MNIQIFKSTGTEDFSVVQLSESCVKIKIKDKEEIFDFTGLEPGCSYFIADCLHLPYSPVERIIIKEDQSIELKLFFSDQHLTDPVQFERTGIVYSLISQLFNISQYKKECCDKVTKLSVEENYKILPPYKRDNVYAGSPATDSYPSYLKGAAGLQTIAKLNTIFQQTAVNYHTLINNNSITTKAQVDEIMQNIIFPSEEEIIAQIIQ